MNKYELEKTLSTMNIIRELLFQHVPEFYTRDISPKVLETIKKIQKEIENIK